MTFWVLGFDDDQSTALMTRRAFSSLESARRYAATVAPTRLPFVVRDCESDPLAETLERLVDLAESLADATSVRRHERALITQARNLTKGKR